MPPVLILPLRRADAFLSKLCSLPNPYSDPFRNRDRYGIAKHSVLRAVAFTGQPVVREAL